MVEGEDDIPFIDDEPLEDELPEAGAADDPLGADEPVLGLAVAALPVPDEDGEDVPWFEDLWQPANAKRTAEARINFFIMISDTLGVRGAHAPAPNYIQCRGHPAQVIFYDAPTTPIDAVFGPRIRGQPHALPSLFPRSRRPLTGSGHADRGAPTGAAARAPRAPGDEKSVLFPDTMPRRRRTRTPGNPPRRWRRNNPT